MQLRGPAGLKPAQLYVGHPGLSLLEVSWLKRVIVAELRRPLVLGSQGRTGWLHGLADVTQDSQESHWPREGYLGARQGIAST